MYTRFVFIRLVEREKQKILEGIKLIRLKSEKSIEEWYLALNMIISIFFKKKNSNYNISRKILFCSYFTGVEETVIMISLLSYVSRISVLYHPLEK